MHRGVCTTIKQLTLHNVPLRQYLFPVACIRRVAHNNTKRNVLAAVISDIGNRRTFSGAALAKKSLMSERVSVLSIVKRRRIHVTLENEETVCIAVDCTLEYDEETGDLIDVHTIDVSRDCKEEERLEKLTMKLP